MHIKLKSLVIVLVHTLKTKDFLEIPLKNPKIEVHSLIHFANIKVANEFFSYSKLESAIKKFW